MSAAFIAYLVKMLDSLANLTLYAKLPGVMTKNQSQSKVFAGRHVLKMCWKLYLVLNFVPASLYNNVKLSF